MLLAIIAFLAATHGAEADKTPVELENYFLQSCAAVLPSAGDAVCNESWLAFSNSFANKDPRSMSIGDYASYFQVLPLPERIDDELLLWSRSEVLKQELIQRQDVQVMCSFTITATEIVNYMERIFSVTTWCGSLDGGIDYTNDCPGFEPGTPVYTFFAEFSMMVGEVGAGTVFFLTNAGHYETNGFFGMYELPGLLNSSSLSTRLVVLNVVLEDQPTQCGEGALAVLEGQIESGRPELEYECYNVPGEANIVTESLLDELANIISEEQSSSADGTDGNLMVICAGLLLSCVVLFWLELPSNMPHWPW